MALIYKGKTIHSLGFIGYGRSNKGVYDYVKRKYPDIKTVIREKVAPDSTFPSKAQIYWGNSQFDDIHEDLLFVSPGIRHDKFDPCGAVISSDAEFFLENTKCDVFAITASSGKSTSTALVAELLKNSYENVFSIGNIGEAMTPHLDDASNTAYAAELSSFQLMSHAPKSKAALLGNISPNHLDWHLSYGEYIDAKENVLKNAERRVISPDTEPCEALLKKHGADAVFSSFMTAKLLKKYNAELYIYIEDGKIFANERPIIKISQILRREEYNLKNLMGAMALTWGFWNKDTLLKTAGSFSGLRHRCELIADIDSVKFYDSSIDSSPERTLSTLSSFSGYAVIILGGRTKVGNYEILKDVISKKAYATVITGENTDEIYSAVKGGKNLYKEPDFKAAVLLGAELAKECGALLLSPASTSFDKFKNFEERGERFKEIVSDLKTDVKNERF